MRVAVGLGAWLLGVGAATGSSLLAVSLLGQGIAANTSQQLTSAAVTRALASEASEAAQSGQVIATLPSFTPSVTRPHRTDPPTTPLTQAAASPTGTPTHHQPPPSRSPGSTGGGGSGPGPSSGPGPTPTPAPNPTPAPTQPQPSASSTVLSSQGGTVVAECVPGGVYLLSWSPTQGYDAAQVARGPASTAKVTFESPAQSYTMTVSCSTGVPTATTTVGPGEGPTGSHSDE
jgi:hypothetical protein